MTIERQIIDAAARLRRQREPHLIATVVRVQGSAYRRPGARMLLTQFRWITGSVSGGCLEGDIAKQGWWRTQSGEPVVMTYDSRDRADADDDDIRSAFGLGCDGVVEVLLERAGAPGRIDPLAFASECIHTQKRGALVTVIRSRVPAIKVGSRVAVRAGAELQADAIGDNVLRTAMTADARAALASGESTNRSYTSAQGTVDVFIEAVVPPPRLFVFGTGHDAVPVVQLARSLGWDVTVCADEVRVATRQRFSQADEMLVGAASDLAARIDECDRAVAIVMNHHYELDREHLGMLIGSRARYIGVLGPRARTTRMLNELYLVAQDDPRLHAPVGLQIGAETPHEIAMAVLTEVQAVLARVPAQSLRDHLGPIHDRPMPRIAQEIDTLVAVEPTRPSRELAAVTVDVEPAQRVSREMAVATPVA
jgi:xanthine dehydrogenase accessory factor